MTALTPFQFNGRNIRLIDRDDGVWFVASDVAAELGYDHTPHLVRLLDEDEKGVHIADTPGGGQFVTLISEAGVYRAIVQRRATKKMDERIKKRLASFQRWVFHDVLPSIRKTGSYGAAPASDPMEVLNDPAAMRGLLLTYTEKVIHLEHKVEELTTSKEALDRIAEADGSLCVTDAAKALQIRPSDLFTWLRRNHWIYRRMGTSHDVGYQSKVGQGLLEHKVTTVYRSDGTEKVTEQVRVTPKGLARLAVIFNAGDKAA